jgi:putative DNA primase/helicase
MNTYSLERTGRSSLDTGMANDEPWPYASVPVELKALRAWLPFKIERRPGQSDKPKTLKIPYNIAGRKADHTNSRNWMTFEDAYTMLCRGKYDGLGVVLDRQFGIVGYDADSCISNGTISGTARQHIATLNSYTEESLSGTGVHCLAYGTLPPQGRKSNGFEMYSDRRFFVVTGRHVPGTPNLIEHRPAEIEAVHRAIFGAESARKLAVVASQSVTQFFPNTRVGGGRREVEVSALHSDEQVLRLLQHDAVAWRYFSYGAGKMNPSGADFALGCKLAFYTGGNLRQMYHLFMQSALAKRPKCHTMRGSLDYVQYTLKRCLSRQKVFWQSSMRVSKSRMPAGRPLSALTKLVLETRRLNPQMRACEIARELALNSASVRKILSRYSFQAGDNSRSTAEARGSGDGPKLIVGSESGPRDTVLQAIGKHPGWVKVSTIARETGKDAETVGKRLQQLEELGFVDRNLGGRYRKHHQRKLRKLKPCNAKPIPFCNGTEKERKTLSRTELVKRGWPKNLIDKTFPEPGEDYKEMEITLGDWSGRIVRARFYRVSRIKEVELQPWFENERIRILRSSKLIVASTRSFITHIRIGSMLIRWPANLPGV